MATWKQEHIMLTKVGEKALASAEAGTGKITITRIVGSTFNPSDIYNLVNNNGITNNITFDIISKKPIDDSTGTVITIQATNKNVTSKFRMNTIVVFATQSSIASGEFPYMIAKTLNADEIDLPTITPVTLNFALTILNTRGGLLNLTISNTGFVPIPTYLIDMQDYQNNTNAFGVTSGSAVTHTLASQFLNDHPITLKDGVTVKVKLGFNLKANSTLNVSGTGDKRILDVTGNTIPDDTFTKGSMLNLMYDSTRNAWIVTGGEVLTASNGVKKVGKDMQLVDSGVLTKHIKDLNVTTEKLADKSVTPKKLSDDLSKKLNDDFVNVTGDTMTGPLTIKNSNISFKDNNSDEILAKIRIAPNGNFDIGVTEDSATKNATKQLLLHSQEKPKWYNSVIGGTSLATENYVVDTFKKVYPIGAIYISLNNTNPSNIFGFGTWEALPEGRMLLAQGSNYKAGSTGGESTHTLTIAEMPAHNHWDNTEASGDHTHTGETNSSGEHSHNIQGRSGWNSGDAFAGHADGYGVSHQSDRAGSHTHSFTTNSSGSHTHKIKSDGGGQPHNNMPPYLSVYMWKRVA